jgi:Protein of unknown function (DUF3302)
MFLDYVAFGLLFFVVMTLFYAVIAVHNVAYEIAKHRAHPHQDAIHVAGRGEPVHAARDPAAPVSAPQDDGRSAHGRADRA